MHNMSTGVCVLCEETLTDIDNEEARLIYGPMASITTRAGVIVHVHEQCAATLPNAYRSAKKHSPKSLVAGVSLNDIEACARRRNYLNSCNECGRNGAMLKCAMENCGSYFHTPCLMVNGLYDFNERRAYCDMHVPHEQRTERKTGEVSIYEDGTEEVQETSSDCVFCSETVSRRRILHEVVVHRCTGAIDIYMHLHCSQRWALANKSRTRCPMTMTAEHATRFQFDLRAAGVYISQCEPEENTNDEVPVAAPIGDQIHDPEMPCALGLKCLNRLELGDGVLYHEYQQKAEAGGAYSKPYEMIGGIVQAGERRRCRNGCTPFYHRRCAGLPWAFVYPLSEPISAQGKEASVPCLACGHYPRPKCPRWMLQELQCARDECARSGRQPFEYFFPPEECDNDGYHPDMERFPNFDPNDPQPVYAENYKLFWNEVETEEEYSEEACAPAKHTCHLDRKRRLRQLSVNVTASVPLQAPGDGDGDDIEVIFDVTQVSKYTLSKPEIIELD